MPFPPFSKIAPSSTTASQEVTFHPLSVLPSKRLTGALAFSDGLSLAVLGDEDSSAEACQLRIQRTVTAPMERMELPPWNGGFISATPVSYVSGRQEGSSPVWAFWYNCRVRGLVSLMGLWEGGPWSGGHLSPSFSRCTPLSPAPGRRRSCGRSGRRATTWWRVDANLRPRCTWTQ